MDQGGVSAWYHGLPVVTRFLLTSMGGTTLAANFGLISPYLLALDTYAIWNHYQIWRLVTPFFFLGKLGFPFLISMMWLVQFGGKLEISPRFSGRPADFAWLAIFCALVLLVAGVFIGIPVLGVPLIMAIVFVWTRHHPTAQVNLFLITVQAVYLPWAMLGMSMLMGGGIPVLELVGFAAGHVYYFLDEVVPRVYQKRYVFTPAFIERFFAAAPRTDNTGFFGRNWGTGHTLGRGPAPQ